MNVVDSSEWLEYFADGPNAGFFAPAIRDLRQAIVPSICLLEVFKRVLQQRGEDAALQAAAFMQQTTVQDLTPPLALSAAKIGLELKLSLADSVVLASARAHHALLWTQDADFKGIEDVRYMAKRKLA